jgi:sulfonate transport system substrate-binding protein
MKKLILSILLFTFTLFLAACSSDDASSSEAASKDTEGLVIKIGVQGSGGVFGKAQEDKLFEKAFEQYGATVEWVEFHSGPPMTEAMASDNLDFAGLGNMPVIAAQAANIPFKIISQGTTGTQNAGVIAQADSGITSLHDLVGKKVAAGKGTNAYDFLLRALTKAEIDVNDIEIINLSPDEAQAAFDSKGVDAWASWEPYLTINELSGKGAIIADGLSEGLLTPSYNIVRSKFAEDYPDLVVTYLKTFNEVLAWEDANEEEAVERYATERNLPVELIKASRERSKTINIFVEDEIIEEHQRTADFQHEIGTIRQKIDVKEVFDNSFYEKVLEQQ